MEGSGWVGMLAPIMLMSHDNEGGAGPRAVSHTNDSGGSRAAREILTVEVV
jgi:hypothetical protein